MCKPPARARARCQWIPLSVRTIGALYSFLYLTRSGLTWKRAEQPFAAVGGGDHSLAPVYLQNLMRNLRDLFSVQYTLARALASNSSAAKALPYTHAWVSLMDAPSVGRHSRRRRLRACHPNPCPRAAAVVAHNVRCNAGTSFPFSFNGIFARLFHVLAFATRKLLPDMGQFKFWRNFDPLEASGKMRLLSERSLARCTQLAYRVVYMWLLLPVETGYRCSGACGIQK